MDVSQIVLTVIGSVVGSGAVLGFVEFLIKRRDKKIEDEKVNRDEELKKQMKDHLTAVNDNWKVTYCDKNAAAIESLRTEVIDGLAEREKMGRQRYEEHHMSIEKMTIEHQKDFLELKKAISILTENNSKITDSLNSISNQQRDIADSLLGLSHDKIVYMTDKLVARGAVTMKEKATLESIYTPYVKLGGNSYAKKGMEHVDKLPVVTEEEARKMDRHE